MMLATTTNQTSVRAQTISSSVPSASASPEQPVEKSLLEESATAAGRSIFPSRARPLPTETPRRICSFVAPVCVHAAASVSDVAMAHVLLGAERFYRVMWALGLPEPLADGELGGDARYDLYVLPDIPTMQTIADDLPPGSFWDQTSAFTVLPPPVAPFGCDSEALIARALGRALALRIDAGMEDSAMAMAETYLADIVTDCAIQSIAAVDDLQRFPDRTLEFHVADEASVAFLFARYLDDTYGLGQPGGVLFSLLSVATQHASASRLHFANEPDLFDALRSNAAARGKPIDDLWLDFAVNRAFIGSRSDAGHLVDVDKYGDAGRVRFEWNVPLSSLPRRLAPMRPIEALGSTYLWVDLQNAPENLELVFVADWEAGVLFHWMIVKVDAHGLELGRISIAGIRGSIRAERSLLDLRGVSGLVIVGVNCGSIDRGRPFDPDEQELPRSYTVSLFR